jgi:nucleoside-diphosphate-sugar epimerase
MTSLITGGSGFTGTGLAKTILGRGEKAVIFDLAPSHSLSKADYENLVEVRGDITNEFEMFNAVREVGWTLYSILQLCSGCLQRQTRGSP